MIKMLLIADDFTGALDAGVQFAKVGIQTFVATNIDIDLDSVDSSIEVLAVNTESRHDDPKIAHNKVKSLVSKALDKGIVYIYKKTDSVMRGNIGAELSAMIEATGNRNLPFIPAYPDNDRITVNGLQIVEGVSLDQSAFSEDPFTPVRNASIQEIIKNQSEIPVHLLKVGQDIDGLKGICVFDASSNEELYAIGQNLKEKGKLRYIAGCAGFASVLPRLIDLKQERNSHFCMMDKLLILSGSVNDVTLSQIDYAKKHGVKTFSLTPVQKMNPDYLNGEEIKIFVKQVEKEIQKSKIVILTTIEDKSQLKETEQYAKEKGIDSSEIRTLTMHNIGRIANAIIKAANINSIMVIGGDTLKGVVETFNCRGIVPIDEIALATVYGKFICEERNVEMISKSGGLGEKEVLWKIVKHVRESF